MRRFLLLLSISVVAGGLVWSIYKWFTTNESQLISPLETNIQQFEDGQGEAPIDTQNNNQPYQLSIVALRQGTYPGSEVTIEEKLSAGGNYSRYLVSYLSEGLKIYALLTIPNPSADSRQVRPETGWPVIIFNHGYIPPAQYKTTERYVGYVDSFARDGYIVFKPDFRGHGNSQGLPTGGYGSNGYTIDVLNAVSSIKRLKDPSTDSASSLQASSGQAQSNSLESLITDPTRIGMWGHSMGGFITLRNMVVNKDIKAGVIWAGVVGSYEDLFARWRRRNIPSTTPSSRGGSWRQMLSAQYGTPEQNPSFWGSLSANSYLGDISGPLQLHHGTADVSVPLEFSQKLASQLEELGKEVEIFTYQGDDHNLSANFTTAINRSVRFFDKYLKD